MHRVWIWVEKTVGGNGNGRSAQIIIIIQILSFGQRLCQIPPLRVLHLIVEQEMFFALPGLLLFPLLYLLSRPMDLEMYLYKLGRIQLPTGLLKNLLTY